MPHTPSEKRRAIARLRRIKGQAQALELAVEAGTECGALLQQIAALRGATTGLMAEVLEMHLRETLQARSPAAPAPALPDGEAEVTEIMRVIRPYLK